MDRESEMTEQPTHDELLALTSNIVSAHISKNETAKSELPKLIKEVYGTLSALGVPHDQKQDRPNPAVPIKKSVTPDYLICLEDGKKLKMLKRHLRTAYDMSPEEYRARWELPGDYPMVAPNYAKMRSELARKIGLGTRTEG